MKAVSDQYRRRIEAEELSQIVRELQKHEESSYTFLAPPDLYVRRYQSWFENGGIVILAMAIATITLVANYFIFVRLLHVQF